LRIRLKKVYRAKARVHWNLDILKDDMVAINYRSSVSLALDKVEAGRWLQFKDSVTDSATQVIGRGNEKKPQKPWVTDEMLEKMKGRSKWKSVNTEEGRKKYKSLNNQLRYVE